MDINQLLYNHQLALMNAKTAVTGRDRDTYFDLVAYYEGRIRQQRHRSGQPRHRWGTANSAEAFH